MATNNLTRILEDEKLCELINVSLGEKEKFETFIGQRRLIPTVMAYVIKWKSTDYKLRDLFSRIEMSGVSKWSDPSRHQRLFALLMSLVQELRAVFTVPKWQMSNNSPTDWGPKEEITVFIHFLHQILEKLMDLKPKFVSRMKSSVTKLTKILTTELEFLITFLGDAPMRLQGGDVKLTRNVLEDIRVFVNEVGSFLYEIFSTLDVQFVAADRLRHALLDLLRKSELLKEKIKEHCTLVLSKLQGSPAIKSKTVVSPLFIVDSLLDDLKDLIDHKADSFGYMKELMLLRSSLDNITLAQRLEEVVIPTRDLVCDIEYVINSSPPWYLALRVPQFLEKIQLITVAIQEKSKCGGVCAEEYPRDEQLASQVETPIFVGFQNEAAQITEKLIGGPVQQQIISLVGMPGLGKTTLASKLFNYPSVVHHFQKRAWCVVSQTYVLKNLLIDILASTRHLKRETMMQMEEDDLAEELYKSLKRMRYLIVLDDIWNVRPWDDLKRYFQDDVTGSRILFTTRNSEVGLQASPNNIIELPFLSDDECWELIERKLLQTQPCPLELLEIGKEIATSCSGLPLSATLIASVLANMPKNESSWKGVARNLSTHLLDSENNCLPTLKLSYQHLPAHLKPCFLYFGAFREDEVVPVRNLISLWVAEGFIKQEDNKSLEDVACSYLINLINRGLVLVSGRRSNGGIKTCIIHDLLRDMCLKIAKEENIMRYIGKGLSRQEQDIDRWVYDSATRPFGPYVRSDLGYRSLEWWSYELSYDDIREEKYMRAVIPNVHLRYVKVRSEEALIERSNKLEYLLVGNMYHSDIPENVLMMEKLRHLHIKGGAHFSKSCRLRANKDSSFLIKNVQSISLLNIHEDMDAQVLGCAPNLRRLKCKFMSRCPSFHFPDQLESLNITYIYYGCPKFPLNLKKLTLYEFSLFWETVRMIGRLQNLEVLKLRDGTIKENNWETEEGEFQNLKFLELSEVRIAETYEFAEWNPETDHYPKLQRLVLRKCHCLKTIPSSLGHILQTIEVHGGEPDIAKSAMDILEEQKEEYGNEELKVIITHE